MSEPSIDSSKIAETLPSTSKVFDGKSLRRNPGEPIKSDDWNQIINELVALREYVNNMTESLTLTGLVSRSGYSFPLDAANPPGYGFGVRAVGLITAQWVAPMPTNVGEICSFGVTDNFEIAEYWACADNGDKNTLDIVLEYVEGPPAKAGDNLYVNSRAALSMPAGNNHYLEYLNAPGGRWYKYQFWNKNPDREVRAIKFMNVNKDCVTRIGNVIHLRTKIKTMT